ncbi:MAG: type II CAAX endopeptidase family protein [Dehalococcoidia bacterium]|nr:type II CAAX endopeptidase family protein [Dehalococcoidia bacterium]
MEEKVLIEEQTESISWTVGDLAKGITWVIIYTILVSIGLGIGTVLLVGSDALTELASRGIGISEFLSEFFDLLASEGLLTPWLAIVFVGMLLGEGAFVLGAWQFSVFKYKIGWSALGFRSFNMRKGLLLAAGVVLAGLLISVLYDLLMSQFGDESSSLILDFTDTALGLATITILAVVLAPFAEEIFFRGFLFTGIGNRYGNGWGAVFSALIFAIAHLMQPGAFLPIFLLGLLLAWLYMKTGSIWACIITHSVYNSLALVFMLIY